MSGAAGGELERVVDRVELRELVDAYAQGVDHRDGERVAALFVEDGLLATPRLPDDLSPVAELRGRVNIARAIRGLERYVATMHAVVAQTVEVDGERAMGETSCLAHHVRRREQDLLDTVWAIRYEDAYVREGGRWRFASRRLWLEWTEDRPVALTRKGMA